MLNYKLRSKKYLVLLLFLLVIASVLNLVACKNEAGTENVSESMTTVSNTSAQPTPQPTATPAPSPTPVPTPTPIPVPTWNLQSLYPAQPIYESPDDASLVITELNYLQEVGYLRGPDDGWFQILLDGGVVGYCPQDRLSKAGFAVFAKTIEGEYKSALPTPEGEEPNETLYKIKLVDVRKYAPEIQISQAFASDDNFLGETMYARPICLLQEATLIKLKRAQEIFAADGYTIKIYDAYRPYDVTVRFGEFMDNPIYLASPLTGSHHNRGVAVDMTLVDQNGLELEMPSLIHTLNFTSSRLNEEITPEARRNLDYMSAVMESCGFLLYKHEWWHYTDSNRLSYPNLNFNLGEIEVEAEPAPAPVNPVPLTDPRVDGFVSIEPTPVPTPTPEPTPEPTPVPTASQ
jgi:D-alanyl-D-alanine dipeptidase